MFGHSFIVDGWLPCCCEFTNRFVVRRLQAIVASQSFAYKMLPLSLVSLSSSFRHLPHQPNTLRSRLSHCSITPWIAKLSVSPIDGPRVRLLILPAQHVASLANPRLPFVPTVSLCVIRQHRVPCEPLHNHRQLINLRHQMTTKLCPVVSPRYPLATHPAAWGTLALIPLLMLGAMKLTIQTVLELPIIRMP